MNSLRNFLIFVMCVWSATCQAQRTGLPAGALPDGMGVNIHFTRPRLGEMEMLAAAGFRWVRMDFTWNAVEQTAGSYNFAAYDELISALDRFGIRAIFILDYVNPLYDSGQSPHTEQGRRVFARWAAASARHFAGKGIVWEIYNEPNISPFWHPKPNVADYVQLALAASRAIKASAPGEIVAGPATSRIDLPFLEDCFKGGLLRYWDAVTVHPYRSSAPETSAPEYRSLRRLIARYAPARRSIPILSGEWGYSSAAPGVTPDRQAVLLVRQLLNNLANDVHLSIWYDWHDDGPDAREREHNFGTVRNLYSPVQTPVYQAKPAYIAAKTLFAQLNGYQFNKRLAVGTQDDFVLLFVKGDSVRLAAWTSSNLPHEIAIPSSPGKMAATVLSGDSFDILRAQDGVVKLTVSESPVYLAPEGPNDLLKLAASWERAPLEVVSPSKDKLPIRLWIRNYMTKAIRVSTESALDVSQRIEPNKDLLLSHLVTVTRDAKPQVARLTLNLAGLGAFYQGTTLLTTNPLDVTILPRARLEDRPEGFVLPLMVSNPSGEAFSGVIRIARGTGMGRVGLQSRVEFIRGETRKLVNLPLSGDSAQYSFAAFLEDNKGKPVLMAPLRAYATVDVFWKYPVGQPPYSYRIEPDGDPKVLSEQSISSAIPPAGMATPGLGAIKLTYKFQSGHKFLRLTPKSDGLKKIEGKPRALGLWIYGDSSGDYPRLRIVDSSGQTFQGDGPAISWAGWRYVTIPVDGSNGAYWAGAADGIIHYPIKWDALFVLDNASREAHSGTVYITGPTLIY